MAGLGLMYLNGYGVEPDAAKACQLAKQAAGQKDALGQFLMGMLHLLGEEAEPSLDRARHYFELAARQGLVQAQDMLGKIP